ncbi:MAG: potassium channel family protein [Candidatus Binatia bacterium]
MRNVVAAYDRHRHAILFYSLLLTLGTAPLLAVLELEGLGLKFTLAINLLAAVLGIRHGFGRTALLLLAAAAVAAHLAPAGMLAPGLSAAALVFWSVIGLFSASVAATFVLRADVVESEHVYAALSVYMLAGVFFGLLHWTIELTWPGSYVTAGGGFVTMRLFDGIYFSFVTLATLGYGDVTPVSDIARGLSIVESVSGQLYLAVMIARLVGSHLQNRPRSPH